MPGCGQSVPQTHRSGAAAARARTLSPASSHGAPFRRGTVAAQLHPGAAGVEQAEQRVEVRMAGAVPGADAAEMIDHYLNRQPGQARCQLRQPVAIGVDLDVPSERRDPVR